MEYSNTSFNHDFLADALTGLSAPLKTIPAKYFYDARGSHYFDLICQLDEYYLYRSEMELLPKVAKAMADFIPAQVCCVEFGAGSLHKIRPLLQHCEAIRGFIPIDISHQHLQNAGDKLAAEFPALHIIPKAGDFSQPMTLLSEAEVPAHSEMLSLPRLGFFPGSTIGNFTPEQAVEFLQNAKTTLGIDSHLLLGVDTQQDPQALFAAYNDAQNITAEFNKNLLVRMNRELKADFDPTTFTHMAKFNAQESRIEMYLVSQVEQKVELAGESIYFAAGERIHTESSYKYTPQRLHGLVEASGWQIKHLWETDDSAFSVVLLCAA